MPELYATVPKLRNLRMHESRLLILSALLLCASASIAQSIAQDQPAKSSSQDHFSKTRDQRVLGMDIPNYLTVDGRGTGVPPLRAEDKFSLAGKSFLFSPYTFLESAAQAGLEQAINDHGKYGQGAGGYGKRLGADIAGAFTDAMFGVGVYPSVLHKDPRYYRMMRGRLFARGTYAISRVLVTRSDSGQRVFNLPELLASATSSGIATAYYPDNERNVGHFASRMATQIGLDAAFNVVKEFWPDVRDHLSRRHEH
jgi:hypothetical protein